MLNELEGNVEFYRNILSEAEIPYALDRIKNDMQWGSTVDFYVIFNSME